jgi:hypothetical protein
MSWKSRRRQEATSFYAGDSLEMDRRSSSFIFPRKQKSSLVQCIKGRSYSLWTITSAVICSVLLYQSLSRSESNDGAYDTAPISVWNHNHYASKDSSFRERNLLVAQVGQSRPFAEVASRPNRAYARRWGWDYLLHTGEEDACSTVQVLNHILTHQEEKGQARAPYDAVLFLSPDAIITDQDYQFLALLPTEKLVAANIANSKVFVWNLNHVHSLDLARQWLESGEGSFASCDMESLWAAIETTVAGEIANTIQPLQLSETAGLVEPRLIKFIPQDAEQSFPETMGLLEGIADSVCYRYYPRCEVL